ncbi:MAG: DUF2027 domain-containing protein [Paludibacter sp.]|nr:DUF2027 domain-containing protein [Paludibacter sp.]
MIKKGDKVRFLNAVGGGIVTRVDEKKNLVYVEDEDGFEIPTIAHDCVVVPEVNETTNFPKKDFSAPAAKAEEKIATEPIPVKKEEIPEPVYETADGETLRAVLAFFPLDIKQLQTTAYDCYFVNDSNYFLYYNIVNGENGQWKSVAYGMIEPNVQEEICSITKEDLNAWEQIRVQIIPFKQGKTYEPQPVVDAKIRLNTVKFYKLHSFTENEYFEELSLIVDIIKTQENNLLEQLSPEDIKKAMFEKKEPEKPKVPKRHERPRKHVLEIDLHINELVDTTAGMSNADMLQLQMDKFYAVMDENMKHKGQKIVFIHGKGEGVLRKDIEKQLKTKYKHCYFQDASFREYGFGATMVTIR